MLLFSLALLCALCYNGGTVDLLIASAFSLTLFSLLCHDKKQLPFTLLLIVSATLLFNYQQSINSEWSLLLMAGLMMGFAVFWFFSTPSLQQMWLALRWAAIIPILLTSLLGIWHYLVTLKPIDAQMLDANVFAITQYLGFFLLLSLPAPIKRSEILVRTLALFLLMFAFFATYSRSGMGAWLGSFGGIVVLSLIKSLFPKRYLLSIVGVTLLAYAAVMVLPWWLGDGVIVRGLDDISHLSHRLYIFKATWALIQNMPINGYGLGSFMNLYSGVRFEFGSGGYFVHNDYLQLLLEGGPLFLGLLLAYVLFHGWLGLRICFEQRAIVAARKAQYKELLVCVGVAMALSAHALLNYVFYVLSVQLLAAMVLARTVYLARALGYLKRPMLAPRRSVLAVPIVLVFLTSAVTVLGVSRKAFMEVGSLPVPASWVKSTDFAQSVLTLDPDNQAAKVFLFNQLLFRLEAAPTDQQQQVFELAYGLGEQALADYPFDSDYHWRQGFLLQTAMEIGLDTSIAKDLSPEAFYQQALTFNPGNMSANSSLLDLLLAKGEVDKATQLIAEAKRWKRQFLTEDHKILAEMEEKITL